MNQYVVKEVLNPRSGLKEWAVCYTPTHPTSALDHDIFCPMHVPVLFQAEGAGFVHPRSFLNVVAAALNWHGKAFEMLEDVLEKDCPPNWGHDEQVARRWLRLADILGAEMPYLEDPVNEEAFDEWNAENNFE